MTGKGKQCMDNMLDKQKTKTRTTTQVPGED